jgi:hypothetical protein
VVDNGLKTADFVISESQSSIHEYFFRRIGLAVSTIIITILALALYAFVRRLERKKNEVNK